MNSDLAIRATCFYYHAAKGNGVYDAANYTHTTNGKSLEKNQKVINDFLKLIVYASHTSQLLRIWSISPQPRGASSDTRRRADLAHAKSYRYSHAARDECRAFG